MTLKQTHAAIDADTKAMVDIETGRHEIERIPNPYGFKGNWLVLKGTKIGGSESSWRQWQNTPTQDWEEWEVVIED